MQIRGACFSEILSDFEPLFSFNLPESGVVTESFPSASSDYVILDAEEGYDCTQEFSFVMADGTRAPEAIGLDS
jgi:hypothetical protein